MRLSCRGPSRLQMQQQQQQQTVRCRSTRTLRLCAAAGQQLPVSSAATHALPGVPLVIQSAPLAPAQADPASTPAGGHHSASSSSSSSHSLTAPGRAHALAGITDLDAVNPAYNRPGLNGLTIGATSGLETGCFTVTSQMPVRYTVQEVHGLLDLDNKALLRGVAPGSFPCSLGPEPDTPAGLRRFVVIDETVHALYGDRVRQYFAHHGVEAQLLVLPTCEENKEMTLVTAIAEALEGFKINRRKEPIIAIGGGVCLDVAGLAANLFRRNTSIIKVPTTLMAVVDASVGIKTAVNFHQKKNKLGTYQPPLGVLYDPAFLSSLNARHLTNGSAEVLKMACIKDRALFELLEDQGAATIADRCQGPASASIMRRSIQGMLEELEYNLWEAILVRLVDYGHTFSPELEMAALRSAEMLLHGEAVAIDMALSTELSFGRGLLTTEQRERVLGLMGALGLPLWHAACSVDLFVKALEDTTCARDGLQRVPLMRGIGAAEFVYDLTREEIGAAAGRLLQYAAAHGDKAAVAAAASGGGGAAALQSKSAAAADVRNNVVLFPMPAAAVAALEAVGDGGVEVSAV